MAITKANGSTYLSLASDTYFCRNRDFTIMLWVRPTEDPGTNGQYQSVIGCWDAGATNGWSLAWNGDLIFNFGWAVAGAYTSYPVSGTALAMSTWYHVAVSYNAAGGIWEQFVNGQQTRLVDETSTIPSVTATMRIGQDPDNPTGLAGSLAYVRVFEGYFAQAEIQAEMRSPVPVNRRFPCSLDLPLDNLGTSTVVGPDRSYTGHHVQSVTGTVTWGAGPPAVTSLVESPNRRRRVELFVTSGAASTNAAAECATATGAANGPTVTVSTAVPEAAGTATAQDATTLISTSAQEATGTGTAGDPTIAVATPADVAAGTGSALDATVVTGTLAGAEAAAATGAGLDPVITIQTAAVTATGTAAAGDPGGAVSSPIENATGLGTALDPTPSIAPSSIEATATAAALDATVTASGAGAASAQTADAVGTAHDSTISVSPVVEAATALGVAEQAAAGVTVNAGLPPGSGVAQDATVTAAGGTTALAEPAEAVAVALDARVTMFVNAEPALATASAWDVASSLVPPRDITINYGRLRTGWTIGQLEDGWQVSKVTDGWTIGTLEG